MTTLILSLLISASCTEGLRKDPVLVEKGHYVYFLSNEKNKCNDAAEKWNNFKTDVICGCKQLKFSGIKDRILMKCMFREHGKISSGNMMVYHYYNKKMINHCYRTIKKIESNYNASTYL